MCTLVHLTSRVAYSYEFLCTLIEGWSTTIRPLLVITVLAVPKSMAISWVSDGKSPIFSVLFSIYETNLCYAVQRYIFLLEMQSA